ncbi:uncharacterized protein LOC110651001 isoform X2 [Hevea brasiliensis]|uniref:uncharacterized protein LOC110651001 isoform X2 n=1 Tax=Hevea brasiliensis TaxID=3981 RepID=UPI0025F8C1A7|nr:uncharacterized protein LOC110651001 isoform X2 [Hevea brasiliensis]
MRISPSYFISSFQLNSNNFLSLSLSLSLSPNSLLITLSAQPICHIFPAILLAIIFFDIMNPQSTMNPSKALEGVHGIHVVPHSPFALEEITQQGDFSQSTCGSLLNMENQQLLLQRVWEQIPECLRPIKCCVNGDRNLAETAANVLTSLPFIALGLQAPRKNLHTKLYANSLIGVGVASSLYHSSRGKIRKYLRWFDYTMIAAATICLSRALRNENPKFLMAASAALLPIQPLMVSVVHTGMMEHLQKGH